nr:hypothetical protein [Sporomusa sphaeroides]
MLLVMVIPDIMVVHLLLAAIFIVLVDMAVQPEVGAVVIPVEVMELAAAMVIIHLVQVVVVVYLVVVEITLGKDAVMQAVLVPVVVLVPVAREAMVHKDLC